MGTNVCRGSVTWNPSVWYDRGRRSAALWDLIPLQITGIDLVFGFLGLYFSDVFLVRTNEDADAGGTRVEIRHPTAGTGPAAIPSIPMVEDQRS